MVTSRLTRGVTHVVWHGFSDEGAVASKRKSAYRYEFDTAALSRHRRALSLSRTELGALTGRSAQAVHCWETVRFPPGITVFLKIRSVLKCKPEDLLRRVEDGDELIESRAS
jgi:DNA-binding XRE family transcriptional regulator